jgi:hypothetical protein
MKDVIKFILDKTSYLSLKFWYLKDVYDYLTMDKLVIYLIRFMNLINVFTD